MAEATDPGHDRQSAFNGNFLHLLGEEWTAPHFAPKGQPPAHVQAAWPWRREVWHAYFLCRRAIGQAYYRYTSSDYSTWSELQIALERLYHCVAAHAFHNAFEDRIAQLANACGNLGVAEGRVSFGSLFGKAGPPCLAATWAKARSVIEHGDWKAAHALGNELKHRWTGQLALHDPAPSQIRADLDKTKATYICYGLIERSPEQVDEACLCLQRSLNLLVELAIQLDQEIGWNQYFCIARRGDDDDDVAGGNQAACR